MDIHPLYLMLPVTVSCSYAFMFPVATAPNAIAFSASEMTTSTMVDIPPQKLLILILFLLTYI